ncbi:ornithine carbamoyltransferase [Rhizobium skierniewicense]|uniref:ornithine carbamoyltransferase n=1 Tax=Rhizobium skierniewicense TaxID=984260 RepID=UPI0015734257|nr:ornithine carbamoyltransferase [Rhizobium skierniewicense]NTF31678.1 ornithine carbamoyltransferase [Rhizobium skierniewicense]
MTQKSFLEFHQLDVDTLNAIMARAEELARAWSLKTMPQCLAGKRLAVIVDDTGWRNTTAFDLGIQAMGGISVKPPVHFNASETTADLAAYLDNWFDIFIVRTISLETLRELDACSTAPVINARTTSNHPCETLGDLSYIRSRRGDIAGLKVVCLAPDANILRSWVEASIALPIEVVQVYPQKWHVHEERLLNKRFRVSTDMRELLDADVIITDSWAPDGDPEQLKQFSITATVLDQLKANAIFLPCPPVERGEEVSEDAMEHALCQSKMAKAYLMHAQNALLEWVVSET